MKILPHILLLALIATPSCEKVRNLATKFKKESEALEASKAVIAESGPLVSKIAAGGFDTFTRQAGKLVIVDFYADWCRPCKQLAPILDKIVKEHGGSVIVGKVNVDDFGDLAAKHGVRGIPDVRIFLNGKQVDKFVGLPPESEVRRLIDSHVGGLPKPTADDTPETPQKPSIQPIGEGGLPPGMQRR